MTSRFVTYPNFEADDILGTLARQAAAQGTDVLVMTGDRDMFQLVDERVKILYTSGGPNPETKIYGVAEVAERYGLTPQQFIDLKALIGDTSDNIPGVPGVGDKTAIKFLQQFGSLDELYAHVDEISGPKTRQSLIDARELVMRNKRLVTIHTDLPIAYDADACRFQRLLTTTRLQTSFNQLEFRSLTKELPALAGEQPACRTAGCRHRPAWADVAVWRNASARRQTGGLHLRLRPGCRRLCDTGGVACQAHTCSLLTSKPPAPMPCRHNWSGSAWPGTRAQAAYIPLAHADAQPLAWNDVRSRLHAASPTPTSPRWRTTPSTT